MHPSYWDLQVDNLLYIEPVADEHLESICRPYGYSKEQLTIPITHLLCPYFFIK